MSEQNKRRIKEYAAMVEHLTPKSETGKGCLRAFWVGGVICTLGQVFLMIGENVLGLDEKSGAVFVAVVMVFLSALLTGLGLYAKLGKYAGAGSVVPITGFANSMVAPAMEYRHEGFVMGIGARMFLIAGPVLVYGVGVSVILGVLGFIFKW